MADIAFFDQDAIEWAGVPDDWEGKVSEGAPDLRFKALTPIAAGIPNVQFVEYDPGHNEKPHSHAEGEVFYVLDGELSIGSQVLRAGAGAFVPRDTVYGPLVAGSEGVRFLRVGMGH